MCLLHHLRGRIELSQSIGCDFSWRPCFFRKSLFGPPYTLGLGTTVFCVQVGECFRAALLLLFFGKLFLYGVFSSVPVKGNRSNV
mmetsp:Transcript_36336/g.67502  ORF Transcript_36336/g.67502 Transcript_36336/m.67502 type:complete len:85 (-) Transcript_36336:1348-1602(-)